MAMTAFTYNWRVSGKIDSIVDQETYYIDLPATSSKSEADSLATELRKRKMINVRVSMNTSLPLV